MECSHEISPQGFLMPCVTHDMSKPQLLLLLLSFYSSSAAVSLRRQKTVRQPAHSSKSTHHDRACAGMDCVPCPDAFLPAAISTPHCEAVWQQHVHAVDRSELLRRANKGSSSALARDKTLACLGLGAFVLQVIVMTQAVQVAHGGPSMSQVGAQSLRPRVSAQTPMVNNAVAFASRF